MGADNAGGSEVYDALSAFVSCGIKDSCLGERDVIVIKAVSESL